MLKLTTGQELAVEQLNEIAIRSYGVLEIRGELIESKTEGYVWARLSLETREYRNPKGLLFRDRERLDLHIPPGFPLQKPSIYFGHKRFIGTPHVQWGRYICLYLAPDAEYNPSDGLFGFFERVHEWMVAAGKGELDPENAPLHPPVAMVSSEVKFVVRADTPQQPFAGAYWLGRADLRRVRDHRFDVISWTHLD